jgi:hypothetical protein
MEFNDLSVSDKIAFLNFIAQTVAIRRPVDFAERHNTEEIIIGVRELAEKYARYIDGPIS